MKLITTIVLFIVSIVSLTTGCDAEGLAKDLYYQAKGEEHPIDKRSHNQDFCGNAFAILHEEGEFVEKYFICCALMDGGC